jgi:transmembrane sensor
MERTRLKLNTQIYEEASSWFVECRAGDLDDSGRREFDRWLRKSPEHVSAYLEVAANWSEGPRLDTTKRWDAEALISESKKDQDNVVPLGGSSAVLSLQESVPPPQATASTPPPRTTYRRRLTFYRQHRLALAASIAVLGTLGALGTWFALSSHEYSTAVGEQRSIALADGSTVSMNSKSRIRVRYSKAERAVDLLEGQALFHVAKDKARPFFVKADGTRVRAVGTQFDVYERQAGTVVTVLEGEVAVSSPAKADAQPASPNSAGQIDATSLPTVLVSAGEQVTVTPKQAQKSTHANVTAATAWMQRQIVFESATLSEVAEEFNRYNERQLIIEDPDLLTFHVSGVFSSTDPDSLIHFLRERPGVKVTEDGSKVRISKNI